MKLHHSLAESLDADQGIIAQFLAPEPDAAIEAVVYDLAYISAAWLGKRVLFVNGTSMKMDAGQLEPVRALASQCRRCGRGYYQGDRLGSLSDVVSKHAGRS